MLKKDKNKYSIYGDNEQEKLETLAKMDESGEIEALIQSATAKVMKSRAKDLKKHRKIKDTTTNRASSLEMANTEPLEEARDSQINPADLMELPPKENEPPVEIKKPKEKPAKSKKSVANKIIKAVFTIIMILAVLMFFSPEIKNIYTKFIERNNVEIAPVVNPTEDPTTEVTPQPTNTPNEVIINGKLDKITAEMEFTVNDSLKYADKINKSIKEYFNEFITLSTQYINLTGDVDLTSKVTGMKESANADINTLNEYKASYTKFSGENYIQSAINRLENYVFMLNELSSVMPVDSMVEVANKYIAQENEYAAMSKESLKLFLDQNNIPYTDNGDFVNFTLLSEEDNVKATEGPEVENIQTEPTTSPEETDPADTNTAQPEETTNAEN